MARLSSSPSSSPNYLIELEPSLVSVRLGSFTALAKSQEQKLAIATRASLELLLFNTKQSKANKSSTSRIKELEDEINKLKIDVKDAKTKTTTLETEKKTLETTNTSLQQDLAQQKDLVKNKDKTIADLEEKITDLQLDIEELETAKASGWQDEKNLIKREAFGEGIHTYCKTFLAGEPNYDWRAKFGKHMARYMTDLAVKEAEFIAQKRIELAQMVANEVEELARQPETLAQPQNQNLSPANNEDKEDSGNAT